MILRFLLALSLATLLPSSQAFAKSTRVLDLSALAPQSAANILKQFPILNGGDFQYSDLDALIRHLITQEQYDSAQIQVDETNETQTFTINVGKTRRVSQLQFSGMKAFSEGDLRREFIVGEKSLFEQQALIDAGERIRKLYRDQGYLNAIVDLDFSQLSATDMAVNVKINEGPLTRIKKIELKASNPEFQIRYLKYLEKKLANEAFTDQNLNSIRKNLREELSSHRFYKADLIGPDVQMNKDDSEAQLTFSVPNSEEFFIEMEGALEESPSSIKEFMELDKFYSANPNIAPELATRVKNFYLSRGYARVEVVGDEEPGSKEHTRVIQLHVTEGPQVRIKEFQITGRISRLESYYIDFIKNHSGEILSKGFYNRDALDTGLKNLIISCQNQGFLKAKIISTKTVYSGSKKEEILVSVNIDEGPLTLLENLKFEGNLSYSEADLMRVIGLKPNDPLRLNELENAVVKIKEFYRNSGFLEMSLLDKPEDLIQYNSDATAASVRMKISEGPKVIVAGILIEGNSITKDYVILKELEFRIGDTLTPQLIDESISRLYRLGHFSSVDIKTLEEKTQLANRTVVIRVTDRDPGLFNLGIGANNERGLTLRGYTGIAYRNILGSGRGVSLRLEGNYNLSEIKYLERKVTIGYLEPYLFDSRMKLRLNYTQAISISNFDTRKATELKQITWSVEQDITSHILLSYDVWSSAQFRDFPIDQDNTKIPSNEQVIVTTGPNLDIDFRDHPFNPSKGTFTRLSAEYSTPTIGSSPDIEFLKATGSFSHYYGFWRPGWVLANSVRSGILQNLSAKGGVPYDKKGLSLGGQSTVRGFQPGEAFPNELDLGVPTDLYRLKTQASMYLIKSEIRFPIVGAFGAALFYDGGAVFIQDAPIPDPNNPNRGLGADPYRDAVGMAFRYATPVGAVSFEWAYKLDRRAERNESQWPFYFSIGTF